MTFSQFSDHLSRIEATTKRLQITAYLADLFRSSTPEEIKEVTYLALGQLAPLFAAIDFGLADKMVMRAVAGAYGQTVEEVKKEYKEVGDLGTVAEQASERVGAGSSRPDVAGSSRPDVAGSSRPPTVSNVYNSLLEIAKESGEGSQERKLLKLADLLKQLNPLGAKYCTRIVLGRLRLGFSDRTVLDALSLLVNGDKSARVQLEHAYNVRPDVGWLANKIQNSEFRIQNFHPEPRLGTPVLPSLCQRLPSTEEIVSKMGKVAVEPKWDGQRLQAHVWIQGKRDKGKGKKEIQKIIVIKLFTRSLEDVTEMFPDLISALSRFPLSDLRFTSAILDGEVVGVDPKTGRVLPFQTMITRKRKYDIQQQLLSVPIKYMVFDILHLNGKSVMSEPFSQRRKELEKLTSSKANLIQAAPQLVTDNPQEIRKFLQQQIAAGLEGIVAKKIDEPYSPGRTGFTWVKLKWEGGAKSGGLLDTVDCLVMGTYAGRGKRAGFGVGAFLVGIQAGEGYNNYKSYKNYKGSGRGQDQNQPTPGQFLTISKIGTGLSDQQWRELKVKSQKLKVKNKPVEYDVPKALIPDTWLTPELVVEIQADNITKSPLHTAGFALRFPRLVRYRPDRRPDQATTLQEVKELYKMQ